MRAALALALLIAVAGQSAGAEGQKAGKVGYQLRLVDGGLQRVCIGDMIACGMIFCHYSCDRLKRRFVTRRVHYFEVSRTDGRGFRLAQEDATRILETYCARRGATFSGGAPFRGQSRKDKRTAHLFQGACG